MINEALSKVSDNHTNYKICIKKHCRLIKVLKKQARCIEGQVQIFRDMLNSLNEKVKKLQNQDPQAEESQESSSNLSSNSKSDLNSDSGADADLDSDSDSDSDSNSDSDSDSGSDLDSDF